jgi:uncharacterized protein
MSSRRDPPRPDRPPTGTLAWVGLAAGDAAVAVEFYAAAFGWEAEREADHTRLRRAGSDVALVYPQTPQARAASVASHWSPFFCVTDTALAQERAVQSGGMLLRDAFDVPGGRIAPIQDRVGAVFSIWTPNPQGAPAPTLSDAWWIELSTPDIEASRAFYGHLLAWSYEESPGGADIRGPEGRLGRMRGVEGRPAWFPSLRVTDIEEARQRAKAAGGADVGVVDESPIGRTAAILDPQGAVLSLLEPADSRHV